MNAPKPRQHTAERILDVTLGLFNRLGEPNVSTSQLCREMGISPGNLFYHHASREALVLGLFLRYEKALTDVLRGHGGSGTGMATGSGVLPRDFDRASGPDTPLALTDLHRLCHALAHCARTHRFLFRDLSDLVSRHRELEQRWPGLLRRQAGALDQALAPLLCSEPVRRAGPVWRDTVVGFMLASLTGSVALDGALDPREKDRPSDALAVSRQVARALALLLPWLDEAGRSWLHRHLNEGPRLGTDPWLLSPAAG